METVLDHIEWTLNHGRSCTIREQKLLAAVARADETVYGLQMERNDIQARINAMYDEGDAPTRAFAHKLGVVDDAILDSCRALCLALAPLLEEV